MEGQSPQSQDPFSSRMDEKFPSSKPKSKGPFLPSSSFLSRVLSLCLVLCSASILTSLPAANAKKSSSSSSSSSSGSGEKRVVCYYTNWSAYRQGPAKFLPDNINPYLCTHLVYAFGGLTLESGIKPFDKYQDIDKGGYTKFNGLKTYNKALKTMIAIGGWNEGSRRFSNLVSDPESRKNFIKYAIRFLRQYQFDGLDLDWEYPASREGGVPEDKKNYAVFIKELREAFEDESKSTGRARLLLTVAVPAGIEWIQKGFDIPTINRNIDFFNLLTYDYHASTEPNANHHAPLKARSGISEYDWKAQLNIEYSINYYLKEGADPDKLVVGLPTYGRSYTLFNVDSYDIDAPSSGPGTKGKFTKEPGYLAYYEICEGVKSGEWRVENGDSDTQGPHAVKHDQWVGYDDDRMMSIKAKWVKDNGLGGIMFWSIDNDDFRGTCHGKPFPLIEAAKLAYLTGDVPAETQAKPTSKLNRPSLKGSGNNRFSTSLLNSRGRLTTPTPPKTTTGASTSSKGSKGRRNKNKNRRNKGKTTTTTTTTTPTPPTTTLNPLSTPAPPTTPDPGVDFECKDDGFFPHPRDCKKYFWCLEAPGLGLVAHHFTCPAGLFFNKNTDSCDYARNVGCKDKKDATTTVGTTTAATTTTSTTTTTTRRPTTTTTTTEAPEEEEYDDEEYEDEEEEEVKEQPKSSSKGKSTVTDSNNGRSVKEINDIKDLLKLIRKLGGVEELEKYLDENPSVAAAIGEYEEDEEEEEKPKSSTSSSIFTRNRFTPSTSSKTSSNTRSRFSSGSNPAPSSLKYTSIQRSRPSTTTTTTPSPTEDDESEEEEVVSTPVKRKSTPSYTTNSRPKYVTLSRKSKDIDIDSTTTSKSTSTSTKAPTSSTETSIVVRYSNDEKLLDELASKSRESENDSEGSASSETKNEKTDDKDKDNDTDEASEDDSDRYVQLTRGRSVPSSSTTTTAKTTTTQKPEEAEEEEGSEEYETEEDASPTEEQSVIEQAATQPQTSRTTTTTTTSTLATTSKPRIRIPTRKNGFAARSRGTTTTTPATSAPTTATATTKTTSSGNRRNLFQNRGRGSSAQTSTTEPASSRTEESSLDLLHGDIQRRVDADEVANEIQTQRPNPRSRSIPSPSKTTTTTATTPSLVKSRSRSRYRSTTEKSTGSEVSSKPYSSTTPIVFRRRPSRITTTTARTTTTTTTTTKRPTTVAPKEDDEEAEYYYYYYDEDDDQPQSQVSQGQHPLAAGPALINQLLTAQPELFQRTASQGLRTETFTPSTSTAQLHQHQQQLLLGGVERAFAKRNLEVVSPKPTRGTTTAKTTSTTAKPKSTGAIRLVTTSTVKVKAPTTTGSPAKAEKEKPKVKANHKWSERAVVPLSEKIRFKEDGTIECLDKGIFPHPVSCKQFVHCVPSEENDGSVRAWVYSCPKLLTFDPIGGMCNYDEFAHSKKGNACIE